MLGGIGFRPVNQGPWFTGQNPIPWFRGLQFAKSGVRYYVYQGPTLYQSFQVMPEEEESCKNTGLVIQNKTAADNHETPASIR